MSRHPAKFAKRQKELERKASRDEKAKKRAERKEERTDAPGGGGDPDIDWIVPGPQPADAPVADAPVEDGAEE